jgi:hypothetical protein
MRKLLFTLAVVSFALVGKATPHPNTHPREQWTGRHGYDHDVPQASVPETTSTLALTAIGLGALILASRPLRAKRA